MRKLIYVPIVHTETDMGSVSESLKEKYIEKYGQSKWLDHVNKIDSLWDCIEGELDALGLCYKNLKIYQDGLPNCGVEEKIVRDVAEKGSKNYKLLIKLLGKGAHLIGTEDPKLLIEEYKIIQHALNQTKEKSKDIIDKYKEKAEKQLSERDKYISKRIDETLKDNETGILFIGIMHKVNEFLPKDIKVDFLNIAV
ncbi:MAG: hypothetical protein AABY49_10880 [Planctomycetota bacterium]